MSSKVVSRKNGDKTMAPPSSQMVIIDLDVSHDTDALTDRSDSGGDKKGHPVNTKRGCRGGSTMKFLLYLFISLHAYYYFGPGAHKKAVNEQIQQLSKYLQAQNVARDSKYVTLEKQISTQKDNIIAYMNSTNLDLQERLEKAKTAFGDSLGFVSKGHHNEEMSNLQSNVEKMEEKMEENMQSHATDLLAAVARKEEEFAELKAQINMIKLDLSMYCAECDFNAGGLHTSCGARTAYIMKKYGGTEDSVKEAVIKIDPNCMKKQK